MYCIYCIIIFIYGIIIVSHCLILTVYCVQVQEEVSVQTLLGNEDPVTSCIPHCYTQDVSLACCLPPGAYTIVPSTYQPNCSANFTLSLSRRIHRLSFIFTFQSKRYHIISLSGRINQVCLSQESGEKPRETG